MNREVEDKLAPQRTRVRQDHDEQPERALAARHRDLADVCPVDLRLLADEGLCAQEDLTAGPWADFGDELAERAHGAGVATVLDHVVEASRAQARVALESLSDERPVRVDEPGPRRRV